MLNLFLTISGGFSLLLGFEISSQCANHIHVETSDVVVVVMDVLVLLIVLSLVTLNCLVLLGFNLGDLCLTLGFHNLTKSCHFRLILFLDFICNPFIVLSLFSGQGIVMLV